MDREQLIHLIKECEGYIKYSKRYDESLIYEKKKEYYESLLENVGQNIIPMHMVSTP